MTKNEKQKLIKDCPFCGGKAQVIDAGDEFSMRCKKCDMQLRYYNNIEYAIEAWNYRVK